MVSELPRLPLGLSDFAKMREAGSNYLYVDKTRALSDLLNAGNYLFFSRPRRFGKSLLCSTIKYLYQGKRELFKGLAIEPIWDWTKTNPVIHVSLTEAASSTPEQLEQTLFQMLKNFVVENHLTLNSLVYSQALPELLRLLHVKTGRRAVVIIDEYEKPVHDHIDDLPLARKLRDILATFYGSMKGCDADIEKLFVTGVGRMVKTSIFSGFNQMKDLTLDKRTCEICGYTDSELRSYFTPFVPLLAQANQLSVAQTWNQLKDHYDGYWWGSGERVYNPWSILNCVDECKFSNFWWDSGTPSVLVKLAPSLKEPEDMDHIATSDLDLLFDLENVRIEPLLWQTGYLTITHANKGVYTLGFPNSEVREAWHGMVLGRFASNTAATSCQTSALLLLHAFEEGDRDQVEKSLNTLFAAIPYQLHLPKESFYHAVFVAALQAGGRTIDS